MPEMKKAKKLRLYKFASEYNLSTESIMEFLQQKGYEIKSHMTILNDEMIADIENKFKKDIESAEKHYRKISEFHKKRTDKEDEDQEQQEPEEKEEPKEEVEAKEESLEEPEAVEAETEEFEDEPASDEDIQDTEEPTVVQEGADEVEDSNGAGVMAKDEVDETSVDDTEPEAIDDKNVELEIEDTMDAADNVVEDEEQEEIETVEEDKPYQTEAEREISKRKTGLKVVGKIDLDAEKKKREQLKAKREEKRKAEQEKAKHDRKNGENKARPEKDSNGKPVQAKGSDSDDADDKDPNKKKKKKRLKAKNKPKVEDKGEESRAAKKKKKVKRQQIDKKEVEEAIKRTMISIDESTNAARANFKKKKRREKAEHEEQLQEQRELEKNILKVTEYISVSELANLMSVPVSQVIQKAMEMGMMVSINQRLDEESITLLADEFGHEVSFEEEYKADIIEEEVENEEDLKPRPPVVTIMGHVDHGKTSLLDYVRHANVVAGESGGITQHIGAYKVKIGDEGKSITFLDTPGHEAFTAMRARGAKVTDIVVLIVAADDAVMPQTVEAINHAQAAGVPIIIAINKVDRPNANPDRIKQQLADRNILVEDWGGKYQSVEISAKTGLKVDELLEKILLEAELLELKANPDRDCRGTVIESQLDKGRGVTATILVEKGTMKVGDPFVAGNTYGRVRAMFDERGNKVDEAGPSTPVLVLGFDSAPQAGDTFVVVDSEKEARDVGLKRQQLKREQDHRQVRHITLDEIANQISLGGVKELPIVVKGDVDGSVEALADSLMKIANKEVVIQVIHKGVGAISEGDVLLAAASQAIIVGFHVRPHTNARKLAEQENVDIRLYNVIYDAINEVKSALEGMLSPVISEELIATLEVRETFKVPKVGTIAGCYVQDGKINRNDKIRLFREGVAIYEGELASLKRFKDDVKEVDAGYECGLNINNFNDIKVSDVIEAYKLVETKKKLED